MADTIPITPPNTNAASVGVTDNGIDWAARVAQVAAGVVAGINTVAAIQMAEKQEKLAKDYLKIAQEQEQYYYDVFVPCENQELAEACSAEKYTKHTDTIVGRQKSTVRKAQSGKVDAIAACASRYCTGATAAAVLDELEAQAGALAAAANMGRRYEEAYADAKDDLRWARRSEALNRGRDMMAQAANLAGFAYGLFGRLGDQAGKGAAGAIGYLGYSLNRNETMVPERRWQQTPQQRPLGQSYPLPTPQLEVMPQARPKVRPVRAG